MIIVSTVEPIRGKTTFNRDETALFEELDTWQKRHILTCGTSLGLFLKQLSISVTPKLDRLLGYEHYGWANEPFITCLQYCTMTMRHWNLKYGQYMRGEKNYPAVIEAADNWPLFLTPLVIVYRRRHVFKLIERGITEIWKTGKDCKTHEYFKEDQDKYLGEIPIPPGYIPFPVMLIIGKTTIELTEQTRPVWNQALERLLSQYSYVPIFHLPNLPFRAQTETGAVNSHRKSWAGLKLLCELKEKFSDYIEKM